MAADSIAVEATSVSLAVGSPILNGIRGHPDPAAMTRWTRVSDPARLLDRKSVDLPPGAERRVARPTPDR